jgi:hypothetical protein
MWVRASARHAKKPGEGTIADQALELQQVTRSRRRRLQSRFQDERRWFRPLGQWFEILPIGRLRPLARCGRALPMNPLVGKPASLYLPGTIQTHGASSKSIRGIGVEQE